MIEVQSLTKVFCGQKRGDVLAVDGVSFSCQPGRIYGLLGSNGAGKTTALRMLATLLQPTSGSARVAGCDVRTQPEQVRAQMGFLAAGTALYGRLTARETITYFGRLNGLPDNVIVARIQKLATDLDMTDFLDRRVDTFSTGMKQKTSIARALIHDPAVLIFDEPTLGLDVLAARAILQSVRECRDAGKTIVYSTHVMSEVGKLCDVVGIIHRGRLVAEGTPAELKARFGADDIEEAFVRAVGNEPEVIV